MVLLCELHDQDRVLRGKAHQCHDTDLDVDIVLQTSHVDSEESAEDAYRQSEQYGEGHGPALVLCGQHQEYEEHGHTEDRALRPPCLFLLVSYARPLVAVALREFFSRQILHNLERLARRDARCVCTVELSCPEHVIALQNIRTRGH